MFKIPLISLSEVFIIIAAMAVTYLLVRYSEWLARVLVD